MSTPMTPAQAARTTGTSRRTIVRAIEAKALKAYRDNRNVWRIDPADLEAWHAPNARPGASAQPTPTQDAHVAHPAEAEVATLRGELAELRVEAAGLKAEVAGLRDRLADTATERDAWKALASRPWWRRL